jgi:alanine dehydrogenase
MKIAILAERKQPADSRAALTPQQACEINESYQHVSVVAQSSQDRVFTDEEYRECGVPVVEDVSDCDVLLGVKEVPPEFLIPGKTYFFFSHTIKEQPYNRDLMRALIGKQIRMVDYECLSWSPGNRILGFGRWAGIVGTYNGFLTWGKKYGTYQLEPATQLADYNALLKEVLKTKLPPIKIGLTGSGRVAGGALEILKHCSIKEVTPSEYKTEVYDEPVFTVLDNPFIYGRVDGEKEWDTQHFYTHHEEYKSTFEPYMQVTDLLINGMYWEDTLPALFTKEDTKRDDFKIKVIADITCDVEGSVPITLRATSIEDPTIGWDASLQKETQPFTEDSIEVMAVTNLPTELPRSASEDFGSNLTQYIIPRLAGEETDDVIQRATICEDGELTSNFTYLSDYAGLTQ